MFFNPHQHKIADRIAESVEKYGPPQIRETENGLTLGMDDREVQSLFAFDLDRNPDEPIGLTVYSRTSDSEITVFHVAVHASYTLQTRRTGLGVGVALLAQVRRIGRSVAGVKRVVSCYRK